MPGSAETRVATEDGRCFANDQDGQVRGFQVENDKRVMATNDSSIVSKAAVEALYHPQPHFYQFFVQRQRRRAPLISRGYWLRMKCIDSILQRFLDLSSRGPKVVINLGAGFDTLPFRSLASRAADLSQCVHVDVDYPDVIRNKVSIIENTPELQDLCPERIKENEDDRILFYSRTYIALACDLSDLESFRAAITSALPCFWTSSLLWISEVSTCYMDTKHADRLIELAGKHESSTFCLLEQFLPQGDDHPFAAQMLQHFERLKSPLRAVRRYPSLSDQTDRFIRNGWCTVRCNSLWDIWTDHEETSMVNDDERCHINACEAFDEWEEFALFACHYFLLVASSREEIGHRFGQLQCTTSPSVEDVKKDHESQLVSTSLALSRRYGTLHSSGDRLFYHGGMDDKRRTSDTKTISLSRSILTAQPWPPEMLPRMCHTVTMLSSGGDCLLAGGRSSPQKVFSDCWFNEGGKWRQVQSLPVPLYRHSATAVDLHGKARGVLVYGGRTMDGSSSAQWYLWCPGYEFKQGDHSVVVEQRWAKIASEPLKPTFAAMLCSSRHQPHGVLLGGLDSEGFVTNNFYQWQLLLSGLEWKIEVSPLPSHLSKYKDILIRFGSTITERDSTWVITGGVQRSGVPAKYLEVLILDQSSLRQAGGSEILRSVAHNTVDRPLLVGHSTTLCDHKVFVAGGGATCFSFGARWNKSVSILESRIAEKPLHRGSNNGVSLKRLSASSPAEKLAQDPDDEKIACKIEAVQNVSEAEFQAIVEQSQPKLLQGLNIGSCVHLWTFEYLKRTVDAECRVVVHQADTPYLTFQPGKRNFEYVERPFPQFIDGIAKEEMIYFRAISSKNRNKPADFFTDFPTLASDFVIPPALKMISERLHSSVLRISGPVAMWLHYDVMANVLFQIKGTKKLLLFPPSDVVHLQIPAGSSSSELNVADVFGLNGDQLRQTHRREVTMRPGDALFIPPLWPHCAMPEDSASISLNVFWKDLEKGYAAGRDAYGNRDVQAYEEGRRDVAKMAARFKALPAQMSEFYLSRLAKELGDKAAEVKQSI